MLGLACLLATAAQAQKTIGANAVITRYCEPLLSGTSAAKVKAMARRDGFTEEKLGKLPILRLGTVMLGVSEAPPACIVQASSEMTFAQGVALVDAWGARHPGAVMSPATKGPDGAPVRVWTSPAKKRTLLVTEQVNPSKRKILAFIMMPVPTGVN
jgi:hypothetical protein